MLKANCYLKRLFRLPSLSYIAMLIVILKDWIIPGSWYFLNVCVHLKLVFFFCFNSATTFDIDSLFKQYNAFFDDSTNL